MDLENTLAQSMFAHNSTLALQMRELNTRVPINHLNLPDGMYRADMLPARPSPPKLVPELPKLPKLPKLPILPILPTQPIDLNSDGSAPENTYAPEAPTTVSSPKPTHTPTLAPDPHQEQDAYRQRLAQYDRDCVAAYVNLDYAQGFPTIDGQPFWYQFAFEPSEAFLLFEAYMNLSQQGARTLVGVLESSTMTMLPFRPTLVQLEELFHIYNWAQRVKAYDMFFAVHRRKERERRSFETEDVHYAMSSRLLAICDIYLSANAEELAETMSPKAFLEMLKTASQLQRISVGLNPNSPGSAADNSTGMSAEVIMRTIAEKNTVVQTGENGDISAKNAQNSSKFAQILQNPELTKMAQEIIIRVQQPAQNAGAL